MEKTLEPTTQQQALFPLHTVLFPGGTLPLQIFEQRYLDMIKACMRNKQGFVVVLISAGKEIGETPETHNIGTYAEIVDWETLDNGLLGITTKGAQPVRITRIAEKDDGLLLGDIEYISIASDTDCTLTEKHRDLVETLQQLSQHPFIAQQYPCIDFSSSAEVSYRLSELLPVSNSIKQDLLETLNVYQRLDKLQNLISRLSA